MGSCFLLCPIDIVCVVTPDLETPTTETKDMTYEISKIKEFVTCKGKIIWDIRFETKWEYKTVKT